MTSHQVQEIVDVHLIRLVGLPELLEVDVLLPVLKNLTEGEVLYEEVVQGVCLGKLQFLVDVLGQGPEDPLEVLYSHNLVLVVDHKELAKG